MHLILAGKNGFAPYNREWTEILARVLNAPADIESMSLKDIRNEVAALLGWTFDPYARWLRVVDSIDQRMYDVHPCQATLDCVNYLFLREVGPENWGYEICPMRIVGSPEHHWIEFWIFGRREINSCCVSGDTELEARYKMILAMLRITNYVNRHYSDKFVNDTTKPTNTNPVSG